MRGVLQGLLCCETNDAVREFLLPVVVHAREGKKEERLWWFEVGRVGKGGFYMGKHFMDCVGVWY